MAPFWRYLRLDLVIVAQRAPLIKQEPPSQRLRGKGLVTTYQPAKVEE